MTFRKQLAVVRTPDIRLTPFSAFVEGIIRLYPYATGHLIPHDPYVGEQRLQGTIGLSPDDCRKLLCRILKVYGIPSSAFIEWRVARRDHSLAELYQLIWGAANLVDPTSFKQFRSPVSNWPFA